MYTAETVSHFGDVMMNLPPPNHTLGVTTDGQTEIFDGPFQAALLSAGPRSTFWEENFLLIVFLKQRIHGTDASSAECYCWCGVSNFSFVFSSTAHSCTF